MSREKVYVVDKDDNVIGEKWRDELTDNDCWRIIAVWVENPKGEILIQQRSKDRPTNPGQWSPAVLGTVAKDKSYEEVAHNELTEELGVAREQLTFVTKAYYRASFGYRNMETYSCVIDKDLKDFTIQKEEVEQLRWISPSELQKNLRLHPENYVIPDLWEKAFGYKFN